MGKPYLYRKRMVIDMYAESLEKMEELMAEMVEIPMPNLEEPDNGYYAETTMQSGYSVFTFIPAKARYEWVHVPEDDNAEDYG